MSAYGKKGGTSVTAGRKAETIVATFGAERFTKRVFFGQRFITVLQRDEADAPLVQAWSTEQEARNYAEQASSRYPVAMVLPAQPA